MIQFERVTKLKNGKIKIDFSLLKIYSILKDNLGFSYVRYNNKGFYLKNEFGNYKVIPFFELVDSFINFVQTEYETTTSKEEILEVIFKTRPIKNGNFAKEYLKKHLDDKTIKEIIFNL
ncbi:MAG: hypothetical protein LLF95_10325 [Bacteroidales bacterium]|nr:hypothetical protein [Bacteroidales bacterium]